MRTRETDVDLVIVGAGLAGLAAAAAIESAGLRTQVVEARSWVGGRTVNHVLGSGEAIEIGGQWVGPSQDRILAMAERLGVETFPTYAKGWHLLSHQGKIRRFRSSLPPRLSPRVLAEFLRVLTCLGRLARSVPIESPWTADRAREWDSITLDRWLDEASPTRKAHSLLRLVVTSVLAAEPQETSLLHALFYIRSGGYGRLLSSAQRWRFESGSQEISIRQSRALKREVWLTAAVTYVDQDGDSVNVMGSGFAVRARRAIVSVPPGVTGRIRFHPHLSPERAALGDLTTMGSVIKFLAVYDEPFWRRSGLSGQASSDTGLVRVVFDNSLTPGGSGVLVAFAEGDDARALRALTEQDRATTTLTELARFFGARALSPTEFVELDWSLDDWSAGCYGAVFPPGAWTSVGSAIRTPSGRIHWAGSETSERWTGYMDGAVRSGERAVSEVLAARL